MNRSLVALAIVMTSGAVDAADPFVGTYKFNAAKSRMSGAPATAEMTLIIAEEGANLVVIPSGKRVDGVAIADRLVVPKAGGTHKAPAGEAAYEVAIVTRTSPNTIHVVTMRHGKEGARIQLAPSTDGKTLSRSIKGTGPAGQQVDGVSVLERQ